MRKKTDYSKFQVTVSDLMMDEYMADNNLNTSSIKMQTFMSR